MTIGDSSATSPSPRNRAERRAADRGHRRRKAVAVATGASMLAGGLGVFTALPASAGTFTVTSDADVVDASDGVTTLREAITLANADTDADVIQFADGISAISVTHGMFPPILHPLSIEGSAADDLTISAGPTLYGTINYGQRFFEVQGGAESFSLRDLTISGARTSNDGGVISSSVDVALTDVVLSDNRGGNGGAINLVGGTDMDLALTRVELTDNQGSSGGAVYFNGGTAADLTIVDSLLSGNHASADGGAVLAWTYGHDAYGGGPDAGGLAVEGTTMRDNSAAGSGGAVALTGARGSTTTISDSTFTGNHSYGTRADAGWTGSQGGGAMWAQMRDTGSLAVAGSTFSANTAVVDGGAILLHPYDQTPSISVTNSTISGNDAGRNGGAVVVNRGDVDIQSSTVTGNTSAQVGGVVAVAETRSVDPMYGSSTAWDAAATIEDSIVSGNGINADLGAGHMVTFDYWYAGDPNLVLGVATVSAAYSLIGDEGNTSITTAGGNLLGEDPELGPLADNGGSTLTHLPADDSIVKDAGDPAFAGTPSTDQRGWMRVADGVIDMGSIEIQDDPTPPTSTTTSTTVAPSTTTSTTAPVFVPQPTTTVVAPTTTIPPSTPPTTAPPAPPSAPPSGGSTSPILIEDGVVRRVPLPPSASGSRVVTSTAVSGTDSIAVTSDGRVFTTNPDDNAGGIKVGTKLRSPIVGLGIHWTRRAKAASWYDAAIEGEDGWEPSGYWLLAADGGVFSFGTATFHGSTGNLKLVRPIVAMNPTPTGDGYWLVAADGGVFSYGDARFFGSTGGRKLAKPIVGMTPTATGKGYWLVAADGGVFAFGDARFAGSGATSGKTFTGLAPTTTGKGYWLIATDGTTTAFGDAD